jgi:hypothetical protein
MRIVRKELKEKPLVYGDCDRMRKLRKQKSSKLLQKSMTK